jgi:hypothetical protein
MVGGIDEVIAKAERPGADGDMPPWPKPPSRRDHPSTSGGRGIRSACPARRFFLLTARLEW